MSQKTEPQVQIAYAIAKDRYAALGVDTEAALTRLEAIPLSLHCWQADDVGGFEKQGGGLTGGIAVTGNYPGKARNADELRRDLDQAYLLVPGKHRLNLHAIYLEAEGQVDRNRIEPAHFSAWVDWAKAKEHGLDFNPTCFSHPLAADGFTLSHQDPAIRNFWVEHCIACRKIGAYFGQQLGTPAVTNIWIPDGFKDTPADRLAPRQRLVDALDAVLAEKIDARFNLDSVEPKLFGMGLESYTTGSLEFYLAYAVSRKIMLTLDSGHYHPTETISDKIPALMLYLNGLLLHISRGVRWDSDHVATFTDDLQAITREAVRSQALDRIHIGLDYFDGSINRIAAMSIGARSTLRALLLALLEPIEMLQEYEKDGDFSGRLVLQEEMKAMPFSAVWEAYCNRKNVPVGMDFIAEIKGYEKSELAGRE